MSKGAAAPKGLAGLFAALVGQSMAGPKGVAAGTEKTVKVPTAGETAKAPIDKKSGDAAPKVGPKLGPKFAPGEGSHHGAPLVAEGWTPAAGQDLKSLSSQKAVPKKAQGPGSRPLEGEGEGTAQAEKRSADLRHKQAAKDPAELAAQHLVVAQVQIPMDQEGKRLPAAAPSKAEAKAIDGEAGRKKSLDDPGLAARIHILDQRKAALKAAQKPEPEAGAVEQGPQNAHSNHGEESRSDRDLLIDLSKSAPSPGADKGSPVHEASATGQNFAALLADRLRDSGNTEIVQSARIILKDGDSGSIRMRLNPPELGNVKIELHLADNSISGKIIVESDAARSAFEKGMSNLQDAFHSGGFESARLEVQVGSGSTQGQGTWNGGGRGGEGSPEPFWSERSRSAAFEPSSAGMAPRPARSGRAVDIVV